LEENGQVRRTHGGATPAERKIFEFDFAAHRQANRRAKQAIARAAVKLVKPGSRLIIDAGTTTLELAHLMRDITNLTVVTPSLAVASELQFSEGIQTVLLGGALRRGSPNLTGIVTEKVIDMFAADIAFQGADGIDLNGLLYTSDMGVAKVDQKVRSRAKKTYVLADSSKIGRTALVSHGHIREAEALITDSGITSEEKDRLEQTGATVIVVPL
jgi:DeoR/GlpR family transcriptional regulator of sugar metabolism